MTKSVISVVNQKGGVAKSTTAINLATAFCSVDNKTLIIDLDPQGSCSTGLGINIEDRAINTYNSLVSQYVRVEDLCTTVVPGLYILPATVELSAAEIELSTQQEKEFFLKKIINSIQSEFDYIIIDCGPSLGLLTVNALTASEEVIIPLQCEFFALEGLSHLLNTITLIKSDLNENLSILGILLTMYDKRNKLTIAVEKDVRDVLGEKVFKTVIPRNVKISEAPSHGLPALIYDNKCSGAIAYAHLAREIIQQKQVYASA